MQVLPGLPGIFLIYHLTEGTGNGTLCKVMAVIDWVALKDVHGIQSFLGFANFYRVTLGFSDLACPLIALL